MANPVSWAVNKIKKLNDSIWHTPPSELSKRKTILIKQLRIIVLAGHGFMKDKVQLRASALTFYTLLSIIPVVAIALAIAKGFGLDQNLESIITGTKEYQMHSELLSPLLERARDTIHSTRGGYLAGVGVIILFWSVLSLLEQIERSFNHIWQISSSRPWYRKFTDYLTIMLIAPVFLILSSSITVFVSTELSEFMSQAPILAYFKPLVSFLIKFAPYFLIWFILTLLFIVMPNTKVKLGPALVSGIIAGTFLKLVQWLYLDLQFGITKLSAIYGGLAAIPLFIILIQTSWIIILLGAELSFANQNVSRYEYESEALNISHFHKRALMLMILNRIIRNFADGEKPLGAETIGKSLNIPVRLSRDILDDLHNASLVSVIHENDKKERLYQPALDINKLTISFVLSRLDKKGLMQNIVVKNKEYTRVIGILEKHEKLIADSDSNILVKDL
ncbi:MAG: YihY/virulence factor BrkB family protein [Bacteroidales bacterium]|nr:YihY/virulence factor BrkB family protein [Bacteroidales bacterium]